MTIRPITDEQKQAYNHIVSHPLQAYEWGSFREKTGVKVIRKGFFENEKLIDGFQLSIHRIPKLPLTIGYLPKGNTPTQEVLQELQAIGQQERTIFIQLEPNVKRTSNFELQTSNLRESAHPLFTKYTFQLDLTPSEDELLAKMQSKTRYNIRVAQRHGVSVQEDNSENAFSQYLKLTEETTKRQKFYAHSLSYHQTQWQILSHKTEPNTLSSHLLTATYKGKVLVAWIVFIFKDSLYYPYGASSSEYREVMASNLMMWETIRFGKKHGLTVFDIWGALGTDPDPNDPWFGFHRFKQGYGPRHIEFVGSYDLVINPLLYKGYVLSDKARWLYLRLKK